MQVSTKNKLFGTLICSAVLFMSYNSTHDNTVFTESNASSEALEIIKDMVASVKRIKSLSFTMDLLERNKDNEINKSKSLCKIQVKPRNSYINIVKPEDGPEVLLKEGAFGGKAVINPNSFPYFNLYLHPQSSIMRGDFHHSVEVVGLMYIADVLEYVISEKSTYDKDNLIRKSDTIWDNREHYVVHILNPEFHYRDYRVQEGEDITSIAKKFFVNDYKIVLANDEVDDYTDVEAGDIIKIPNFYGKLIILFIDKETHLPTYQYIEDEKGLYAIYQYRDIIINPDFEKGTFSMDNENYGF